MSTLLLRRLQLFLDLLAEPFPDLLVPFTLPAAESLAGRRRLFIVFQRAICWSSWRLDQVVRRLDTFAVGDGLGFRFRGRLWRGRERPGEVSLRGNRLGRGAHRRIRFDIVSAELARAEHRIRPAAFAGEAFAVLERSRRRPVNETGDQTVELGSALCTTRGGRNLVQHC